METLNLIGKFAQKICMPDSRTEDTKRFDVPTTETMAKKETETAVEKVSEKKIMQNMSTVDSLESVSMDDFQELQAAKIHEYLGRATRNEKGGPPEVVVVVDPYSTGKYLVEELRSRSIQMVAVRSSLDLAPFWLKSLQPEYFLDVIDFDEHDIKSTVELFSKYNVKHVVPGSEPGVMVADTLADALGCPWNGGDTKEWRRHKFAMQERIRSQDLRAIRQIYSDDLNEMATWCAEHGSWPVVVKPAMSGGCDGVSFCKNFGEVEAAVHENLSVMNVNGAVNDKLLLQECLMGDEYIVDMVSNDGVHVVSGIWRYSKLNLPGINFQHSAAELLPATGDVQDILVSYVKQCLDALHIAKGASHSEVMMTSSGPCLIETGARMHGLKGPKVLQIATGVGTHELLGDILDQGTLHASIAKAPVPYFLKRYAIETCTMAHEEGILAEPIDKNERLRELPSCFDICAMRQPGQPIDITRDLSGIPAVMIQIHTSKEQCMEDLRKLREMEKNCEVFELMKKLDLQTLDHEDTDELTD